METINLTKGTTLPGVLFLCIGVGLGFVWVINWGNYAFLYLVILNLNSVLISIKQGDFPEELQIWGTLMLFVGIGMGMLLKKLLHHVWHRDNSGNGV